MANLRDTTIFSALLTIASFAFCETGDNHFDLLMFTQIWPVSSCLEWKDSGKGRTCIIHGRQTEWTIHGIWPTKKHQIGPLFCNASAPFDITALKPLMPQMKVDWLDVRGESGYGFWRHEWLKHGTCAMQLPSMDTELKYFSKALELHNSYNLYNLLSNINVVPNKEYDPKMVVEELSRYLPTSGNLRNVAVNCARDEKSGQMMFSELIICFDKKFHRMGCEETKGGLYGSCHKTMLYPILPEDRNLAVTLVFVALLLILLLGVGIYYYLRRRRMDGYMALGGGSALN